MQSRGVKGLTDPDNQVLAFSLFSISRPNLVCRRDRYNNSKSDHA